MQKALIAVIASFVFGLLICGASYISAANYGAAAEQSLDAAWKNSQNVLSTYNTKIQTMVQVPAMYRDDFSKVIKDTMTGRYGDGGSKATFQFLKEANINFDSKLYVSLSQAIESGQNEFKNAQTTTIDQVRSYQTNLGFVWRGTWLKIAGYPKKDLSVYKVITDQRTDDIFSGKQKIDALKLR